jgi:hypothetical protein
VFDSRRDLDRAAESDELFVLSQIKEKSPVSRIMTAIERVP